MASRVPGVPPPALRFLWLVVPLTVLAAERTVDLRFGIPTWHQPMANERGAILYDFDSGPNAQP